jgi:hypothetical protein
MKCKICVKIKDLETDIINKEILKVTDIETLNELHNLLFYNFIKSRTIILNTFNFSNVQKHRVECLDIDEVDINIFDRRNLENYDINLLKEYLDKEIKIEYLKTLKQYNDENISKNVSEERVTLTFKMSKNLDSMIKDRECIDEGREYSEEEFKYGDNEDYDDDIEEPVNEKREGYIKEFNKKLEIYNRILEASKNAM